MEELRKIVQRRIEDKAAVHEGKYTRITAMHAREIPTHLANIVIYTPETVTCLKMYTLKKVSYVDTLCPRKGRTWDDRKFRALPFPDAKHGDNDKPRAQRRQYYGRVPWEGDTAL